MCYVMFERRVKKNRTTNMHKNNQSTNDSNFQNAPRRCGEGFSRPGHGFIFTGDFPQIVVLKKEKKSIGLQAGIVSSGVVLNVRLQRC